MSNSASNTPVTVVQADKNQAGIVTTKNQTLPVGEKLFQDGIEFSTAPSQAEFINDQTSLMLANATINNALIVDGNLISFIDLSEGISGKIVEGKLGKVVSI